MKRNIDYSDATNQISIQRVRDCLQQAMSTETDAVKKRGHKRTSSEIQPLATSGTSAPFTRSVTEPLTRDHCFLCQEDDGQRLFTVQTENVGKAL